MFVTLLNDVSCVPSARVWGPRPGEWDPGPYVVIMHVDNVEIRQMSAA